MDAGGQKRRQKEISTRYYECLKNRPAAAAAAVAKDLSYTDICDSVKEIGIIQFEETGEMPSRAKRKKLARGSREWRLTDTCIENLAGTDLKLWENDSASTWIERIFKPSLKQQKIRDRIKGISASDVVDFQTFKRFSAADILDFLSVIVQNPIKCLQWIEDTCFSLRRFGFEAVTYEKCYRIFSRVCKKAANKYKSLEDQLDNLSERFGDCLRGDKKIVRSNAFASLEEAAGGREIHLEEFNFVLSKLWPVAMACLKQIRSGVLNPFPEDNSGPHEYSECKAWKSSSVEQDFAKSRRLLFREFLRSFAINLVQMNAFVRSGTIRTMRKSDFVSIPILFL